MQDRAKKGKTHTGYYWVYHAPLSKLVVVDYHSSRAGPPDLLSGFEGALQSDGYAVYDQFDKREEVTTYGCWAHARRKFFEAKDNDQARAGYALEEIKKLYDVERALRMGEATHQARLAMRQEEALSVLEAFRVWLEANGGLPKTSWGIAVNYALGRWEKLTRYAEDGRIEIDNNLAENVIRPVVPGRKNYLFAGSHDAAQRAAVIYSLLATCKCHEINPYAWLRDVLARIPTHPHKHVAELLPHRWEPSKR